MWGQDAQQAAFQAELLDALKLKNPVSWSDTQLVPLDSC